MVNLIGRVPHISILRVGIRATREPFRGRTYISPALSSESVGISRGQSSLILSYDRLSAIVADQIEPNSERDNVFEEKQADVVHVMDAVNHDGVIRSRDQHGACGEEHAD